MVASDMQGVGAERGDMKQMPVQRGGWKHERYQGKASWIQIGWRCHSNRIQNSVVLCLKRMGIMVVVVVCVAASVVVPDGN